MNFGRLILALLLLGPVSWAQSNTSAVGDSATVSIQRAGEAGVGSLGPSFCADALGTGCSRAVSENSPFLHPVLVEARHPLFGCDKTEECGEVFFSEETHNIRPTAGTAWQSQIMGDTSTPSVNNQCNYVALTNTGITPAMADTTLSGEIVSNGLARTQGTYADSSGVVSVPAAPTATVQGSTGSTTYYYWVLAVNQGIYTTVSSSGTTSTANATLSGANYDQVSWTPVTGATGYYVFRTTSNSAPTGATTSVAGSNSTSQPTCTATTCYLNDIANSLAGTSITVPSSNLTNYGHFTLAHTWTATASQAAQAFGVLTAASSGTMCFEGTFTQVSLNNGDTFTLTETVNF